MKYSLIILSVASLAACAGGVNNKLLACECDAPSCPAGRLDTGSLCACLNNAALFCWYRNNRACASPVLQVCGGQGGAASPNASAAPTSYSTYTPPYVGNGGLNCVEIGYCSRPTKAKTSMTVTVSGIESVITVPVGYLPTADTGDIMPPAPTAAPTPVAVEPPIIFTPIPENPTAQAPAPTPAPTPGANFFRDRRLNHNRWLG